MSAAPTGGPPRRLRSRGPAVILALAAGGFGFAVGNGVTAEDSGMGGGEVLAVPDAPCSLVPEPVVEELVPAAVVEDESSRPDTTVSDAVCHIATDTEAMDTVAEAEITVEVRRMAGDAMTAPEEYAERWREPFDEEAEVSRVDGLGPDAFVHEFRYSDHSRLAEVSVVTGDTLLRVEYHATPADPDLVREAAELMAQEVLAQL